MASRLTALIVVAIVAATFIAGLIVGAQHDDASGPVDLVILNGKVYPGNDGGLEEAVAVRGNQILRVGSNREVKRLRRAQTIVLDAHGGSVLPGFNDSHVHLIAGALALDQVDLTSATTLEEVQQAIRAYATANPARPWIMGRGWRDALFSGGLPTRQALDTVAPDRPAVVRSEDGRTVWMNSRALALSGITGRTRSPRDGAIVKDLRTGEPTGVLRNAALELVSDILPQPSRAEKLTALRAAVAAAHRFGVTSVQTVGGDPEEFDLLHEIRQQGDLGLRVYGALAVPASVTDADVEQLDRIRGMYPDDPTLKIGAVDIVCPEAHEWYDGESPSSESDDAAKSACSAEALGRAVTLLDKHQWQVVVHAAGETDVRAGLEAFERAAAVNTAPARGRRHRIEDIGTIDPESDMRLPRIGIIAEPSHVNLPLFLAAPDEGSASSAQAPISIWNAINRPNLRIVFGSGWPATSMDPRLGLEQVVNPAADPDGSGEDSGARTGLPLTTAIDAYTRHPSYASYDERRKGTLSPGMLADIVILSGDVFEGPPERLKDSVIDVTIFDGKIAYRRIAQATDNLN